MQKREKVIAVIAVIVLLFWLIPGFLTLIVPDSQLLAFINSLTLLYPVVAATVILAVIHIDGKPLLDIKEAAKTLDWTTVMMFAGIIMIALALYQDTTGIPQWLALNVAPLISGFGPFVSVLIFGVLGVLLTNILNNWAVAIVFASMAVSISATTGIDAGILAVTVAVGTNLAFTTPAAFPVVSFAITDPYSDGKYVLKQGIAMMVISMIAVGLMMYPLGMLVY